MVRIIHPIPCRSFLFRNILYSKISQNLAMFENKYRCSAVEMRDYQFQFYFISPFFFLNISAMRWTQKVSINTLFKSKLSKSKQVIQIETIFVKNIQNIHLLPRPQQWVLTRKQTVKSHCWDLPLHFNIPELSSISNFHT
jgi:hypothetical protein